MAVYTRLDPAQMRAALALYDVGALVDYRGVAQGVENTNYIVETTRGRFVLTLFEKRVRREDVPFFLAAMAHMESAGAPAPRPLPARAGGFRAEIAGKAAVLTTFLEGAPDMRPGPAAAATLGATLADLHRAAAGFGRVRENDLSLAGWRRLVEACGPDADRIAPGLAALVAEEVEALARLWPHDLPRGLVHADLFPDNVFFEGGEISGVIDFYFACTDFFAYDLAVTLNAWASDGGAWRAENAAALLAAYEARRPLRPAERDALPTLLRGAALRFLLTRAYDWLNRQEGATVTVKDPLEYRDLLLFHRARAAA